MGFKYQMYDSRLHKHNLSLLSSGAIMVTVGVLKCLVGSRDTSSHEDSPTPSSPRRDLRTTKDRKPLHAAVSISGYQLVPKGKRDPLLLCSLETAINYSLK